MLCGICSAISLATLGLYMKQLNIKKHEASKLANNGFVKYVYPN